MATDSIPVRDAELLSWSGNVESIITLDAPHYNLVPDRIATFSEKRTAFADDLQKASDPLTRTSVTIMAKKLSRDALMAEARQIVRTIESAPDVTDEDRRALAINVKKAPTPVPVPAEAPEMDILSVTGNTVRCRLHGPQASRRGKPAGVAGATVYSFVGETPPADVTQWRYEGNMTRTTFAVTFDGATPGQKVWLVAGWFNPRQQRGPLCPPVGTNVQFGTLRLAA
jgi:hypothetical protein